MSPKKRSSMRHSISDVPATSEGSWTGDGSSRPVKVRKVEVDPQAEEEESRSEQANESSANSDAESNADSDTDSETSTVAGCGKSPEPTSAPCTCNCGGCCCHGASTEPQHCVRCHTDYTFNHSQACVVPHVFSFNDLHHGDEYPRDLVIRSLCCGSRVYGGVPVKGEWSQPSPCSMGWHTTNVDAVKEQYNGLNVLRCDLDTGGKCRRARMKHHAHYDHLYDSGIKYIETDSEDQRSYLDRKREEEGDCFEDVFEHVDEEEVMSARERSKRAGYYH